MQTCTRVRACICIYIYTYLRTSLLMLKMMLKTRCPAVWDIVAFFSHSKRLPEIPDLIEGPMMEPKGSNCPRFWPLLPKGTESAAICVLMGAAQGVVQAGWFQLRVQVPKYPNTIVQAA